MTEFTQINSNRAAILEEDDAPITASKPNGKANGHTEVPCLFCEK